MIKFTLENQKIYVIKEHEKFFNNICDEYKIDKRTKSYLVDYLFNYYDENSPYFSVSILEKDDVIYKYVFSKIIDEKDYKKLLATTKDVIAKIKEVTYSQEERVLESLVKRIDELMRTYVDSEVKKREELIEEPKIVKAINELLAMKDKIKKEIDKNKSSDKNVGGKKESYLERKLG